MAHIHFREPHRCISLRYIALFLHAGRWGCCAVCQQGEGSHSQARRSGGPHVVSLPWNFPLMPFQMSWHVQVVRHSGVSSRGQESYTQHRDSWRFFSPSLSCLQTSWITLVMCPVNRGLNMLKNWKFLLKSHCVKPASLTRHPSGTEDWSAQRWKKLTRRSSRDSTAKFCSASRDEVEMTNTPKRKTWKADGNYWSGGKKPWLMCDRN